MTQESGRAAAGQISDTPSDEGGQGAAPAPRSRADKAPAEKAPADKAPAKKALADKSRARKPRADAQRNREKLLAAAAAVFAQGGPEASLEAVAREAGVGIGTLYRHFPTRESLFQAVYRREAEELASLASELALSNDPIEALRRWLHAAVRMVATKRGMAAVLSPTLQADDPVFAEVKAHLLEAISALIARGAQAGALRPEITAQDLMRALFGFCYAPGMGEDWQGVAIRLLDVFVDGLRAPTG